MWHETADFNPIFLIFTLRSIDNIVPNEFEYSVRLMKLNKVVLLM